MNFFEKLILIFAGKALLNGFVEEADKSKNKKLSEMDLDLTDEEWGNLRKLAKQIKKQIRNSKKLNKRAEDFLKKEEKLKKNPLWNAPDERLLPEVVEWRKAERERRKKFMEEE